MRPARPASLSLPQLSTLILTILILSAMSYAAAPDRITSPIVASRSVRLTAGVPMKARPEFDRGRVDPSLKLSYMTLLTVPSPDQQKALTKLLADQQDPHSNLYHKWLTPEAYADRFGLSQGDVKKLTSWLQAQGFTIVRVARGRNYIVFSGSALQVENAFQTQIHSYEVDGEKHFANSMPVAIPGALSGVVTGLRGLNNFFPKSQARRLKSDVARPDYTTSSNNVFLAPGDVATIYDVSPLYTASIDGTGQTLAVLGQTDIYLADLNGFRSGFGLSTISGCTTNSNDVITACNSTNFKYVLVAGETDPGSPNSVGDDLAEADIDNEWSGAVARNAQIVYVNAPESGIFSSLYYAIDHTLSPVITLSYGLCELEEQGFFDSDEAELQKASLEGITVLNSAGDSGAAGCDFHSSVATGGYAVSYPASSPEVTGVGGTLIPNNEYTSQFFGATNDPNGGSALSYIPELGWNDAQQWGAFCAAASGNCNGAPFSDWPTAQSFFDIIAGGGGVSNCRVANGSGVCQSGFPQPSYQQHLSISNISGQTVARFSPDVSFLSSIYWPGFVVCTALSEIGGSGSTSSCATGIPAAVVCSGGGSVCSVFGGTSVASPIFAGMVTLLNHYVVQNGLQGSPGLGNINPNLYQLATYAPTAFHQVTTGSNGAFCSPGEPSDQPTALQCPSTGSNAGFLGFDASNFDPVTGYNLVTGLGSVDANNLATAWGNLLTASTTSLSPSATQVVPGANVTFTITVTPATASGVVTLYNNGSSTALGTATISAGTGTFSTSSLPVGANSIVGKYVGSNASSNSAPVVVTVTAPNFNWVNTGGNAVSLFAGESAVYTFKATPSGGGTFAADVTLSCSGLTDPTLACVFNTGQTDPTKILAGSGSTNVTLTISTAGPNTADCQGCARQKIRKHASLFPFALPLAGILLVGFAGRRVSRLSAVLGLCLLTALAGLLVACGSDSHPVAVSVSQGTPSSVFPINTGWPAQTAQFTATVTNTSNMAVTWSVTGGAANGTIDANGLYTAPTIVAGLPSSVTIVATSQADSTKSGSATETLLPATVPGTYSPIAVIATEATTVKTQNVSLTVQ